MKKSTIILFTILLILGQCVLAQVAINTDGSPPHTSAILELTSTSKGFLTPRMTEAQMDGIPNPANGLMVYCTNCSRKGLYIFNGCIFANVVRVPLGPTDVYNPCTDEVWMDRDLGASQVATSYTDPLAYGSLYQWGRFTDGHESRTSAVTSVNATTSVPNLGNTWDAKFITEPNSPFDWLIPSDDNLWQGDGGVNSPCPAGYRLPTTPELVEESLTWPVLQTAYASPLKFTAGGYRFFNTAALSAVGVGGIYWSSTTSGNQSDALLTALGGIITYNRAWGFSVRCIKD